MSDWINITDDLFKCRKKDILSTSGKTFHKKAMNKAHDEYEKYRVIQEQKYISSIDELYNKYL